MIIDSHAHYWTRPPAGNSTFGADHDPIHVEQFVKHMEHAGVDKLVAVTRGLSGWDNSYTLQGAARFLDRIRVIGRLDAAAPNIKETLAGWLKQPYMVGLRIMTMFPTDASWFENGTIEKFWPEAEKHRIPVSIYAPERSALVAGIAERHPALPLVVDHIGMRVFDIFERPPGMEDWPNLMSLKRFPNVTIKVSGIPEAVVERYPFKKSKDRVREIYDQFGPDRMMWGSNYPPTTVVCSYQEARMLIDDCEFLSSQDKEKIYARTAVRVFNLPW